MGAPLKEGNIEQLYWYIVSQGLTATPERDAIQLGFSHHFLAIMVEEAQVCFLQPSRATTASDHRPLLPRGFIPMTRVISEAPLILRPLLISLKPICSPNGSVPPKRDCERKRVLVTVLIGVTRNIFCHDFGDNRMMTYPKLTLFFWLCFKQHTLTF